MLKIIGADIVIQSFFTKTMHEGQGNACLRAPVVVSKITGNTKNLSAG